MSKLHDQKPKPSKFICTKCKDYECKECIDQVRVRLNKDAVPVCDCTHTYLSVTHD